MKKLRSIIGNQNLEVFYTLGKEIGSGKFG